MAGISRRSFVKGAGLSAVLLARPAWLDAVLAQDSESLVPAREIIDRSLRTGRLAVSILPVQDIVERVAGPGWQVIAVVGAGRDPHSYEPSPKQMAELQDASVLFAVGVPFERAWLPRLRATHPDLRVVDLSAGLLDEDAAAERAAHAADAPHDEHGGGAHDHAADPHIWTSPPLAAAMSERVRNALCALAPERCADFTARQAAFAAELNSLDAEIRGLLTGAKGRAFLVYHPAWEAFARTYDLEQVAIESEGKEPGARSLARRIDAARADGVPVVFVHAQYGGAAARKVAEAIGARVEVLDPLAKDYLANMRRVARLIAGGLYVPTSSR